MKPIRRLTSLATATLVAGMLGAATSFAAVIAESGGALLSVKTRSNVDANSTTSTTFVQLPGAAVPVTIPTTGGSRLIIVRFDAESRCRGTAFNWCSVRIVAVSGATVTELNPASGNDYAFDSVTTPNTTDDQWEGHAMTRSKRLNPGTYSIRVQWSVFGVATFEIDDWHMTVEQYD